MRRVFAFEAAASETQEDIMDKIEYRVRPVTRYVVTRYEQLDNGASNSGGSSVIGEYDNAEKAYEVGYAVCKAEHDRLGWPPGDERIKYPDRPLKSGAAGAIGSGGMLFSGNTIHSL